MAGLALARPRRHRRAVADSMESTRRWSGYVCPDCRFVFRVPRDHDGTGLVCPSCRRLLKLPVPGEVLPPLVVERPKSPEGPAGPATGEARRRHREAGQRPVWEGEAKKSRSGGLGNRMVGAMAIGLLFIIGLAIVVMRHRSAGGDASAPVTESAPVLPLATPAASPVVEPPGPKEFEKIAEPMARRFLEASDISELLPLIRHPETTSPRLKERWPDGKVKAPGLGGFGASDINAIGMGIVTVPISTRDQGVRPLSFVKTAAGWKIDWESWADWSEMTWDRFLAEKTSAPHAFRVRLSTSNYYNFSFNDETKWRVFQLLSMDGEHKLYGYVEAGSPLDKRLRHDSDARDLPEILSLRFPPDSASPNQVIIDNLITDGWVEPEPTPKP